MNGERRAVDMTLRICRRLLLTEWCIVYCFPTPDACPFSVRVCSFAISFGRVLPRRIKASASARACGFILTLCEGEARIWCPVMHDRAIERLHHMLWCPAGCCDCWRRALRRRRHGEVYSWILGASPDRKRQCRRLHKGRRRAYGALCASGDGRLTRKILAVSLAIV